LRERVLPGFKRGGRPIRIWSAGCSSGQEPYSIGILLREDLPDIDRRNAQVLGTDLSTDVVGRAREAVYSPEELAEMPRPLLLKHFTKVSIPPKVHYRVNDNVRKLVRLARLNLMAEWPMKGPFDLIFCRNVMIYFDKATQQTLTRRFRELLGPDGYLFIGHAESLAASTSGLSYIQPAIYQRTDFEVC
jgi:chemotaxis protein methyltransferase CheR